MSLFIEQLCDKFIRLRANVPAPVEEQELIRRIESGIKTNATHQEFDAARFTNKTEMVLNTIPVDEIQKRANEMIEHDNSLPFTHAIVKSLLEWFKNDFFKWVDTVPCELCNKKTVHAGAAEPTPAELQFGGNRVELHKCTSCNHISRFPRYNDPLKLLETRRGRCGEWANTFTAICRAMGVEARYVLDFTDHVWTEIYSETEKRFIHCDSCENAFDTPLIYEQGWGKKLNYVLAFGDHEVVDVTKRYTLNYKDTLKRRKLTTEARLNLMLKSTTSKQRFAISESLKLEYFERDNAEQLELQKKQNVDWRSFIPRQSGSLEWRTSRGEMGN